MPTVARILPRPLRWLSLSTTKFAASTACRMRVATASASSRPTPGMITANSSPPVRATVAGKAVSVGGDSAPLKFRELVEDGTVSYIGEFPLSAPDTYTFTIAIVPERAAPEGTAPAYTLKFNQDFVAD